MSKGLVQYRELDVRELVRRTEEEAKNLGEDPIQIPDLSRAVSWRPPVAPEAAAAGRAAPKAG